MYKHLLAVTFFFLTIHSSLAQSPKSAVQYYDEGIALQNQNKYTEALASFKNAIYKNPDYKEALYYAGWTCNELKKYDEAVPYLLKAITVWPNEPKVFLELGYTYEKQKKTKDAIENYNKCITLKKDYALAYKYLGIIYYDNYDYEKSLANLNLYFKYKPDSDDDDVYYRKAVSENEMGQYTNALFSINKANELKPNNVKFLNELGYTYYLLANADDALKHYNNALTLDPKSVSAAIGRADVYRKIKKELDEAIKLYAKVLELYPKNIKANYWTGWCYNELGKPKEAIPYLNRIIEIDDKYVSAYTELGYCNYALKDYDAALNDFKKALAIEKTELNLYYTGLCFAAKKEKSSVLKIITDLKALKSDYADKLQKQADKL